MYREEKVLFERTGEYTHTITPRKAFEPGDEQLLEEKKLFIGSADDWSAHEAPRFIVKAVRLPDWLPAEEWIRNETWWAYLWAIEGAAELPAAWQRGLMRLYRDGKDFVELYAAVELLRTKSFRSAFRESLYGQLVQWLEDEEPKYKSPFSPRQWNAILHPSLVREARMKEERIYRDRQMKPAFGC